MSAWIGLKNKQSAISFFKTPQVALYMSAWIEIFKANASTVALLKFHFIQL